MSGVNLGGCAEQALKKQWDTTRDDFVWPAKVGINAVRIPVVIGYSAPAIPDMSAMAFVQRGRCA